MTPDPAKETLPINDTKLFGARMLRITIEVVPFGNEARKRTIGVGEIANVSKIGEDVADYVVAFRSTDWPEGHAMTGRVKNHLRSRGFWPLVAAALNNVLKMKENRP